MQKPNYTETNWPKTRSNFEHTFEKLAFEIQMRRQAPPHAPPRAAILDPGGGEGGY